MNRIVFVQKLGRIDYKKTLSIQKTVESKVLNTSVTRDTLLLLEHEPVYTIGIRTSNYPKEEEDRLRGLGAEFHRADRGGLITFHGPGQLVAYPILNLAHFRKSVKWYVLALEQTLISTCRKFGIDAKTTIDTGVWIGNDKIAAIGVVYNRKNALLCLTYKSANEVSFSFFCTGIHAKRFVTTHGIALNCNVDLDWYKHIVPCGIPNKGVTSLSKQLNRDVSVEETIEKFVVSFEENFNCRVLLN